MAGFAHLGSLSDAYASGAVTYCSFRKVPSQASVARWWVDLSMAAGSPVPQYYASAPLEASVLQGIRGIYHGPDQAPASLFLTNIGLSTPTAALVGYYYLLDYLLYYPFVDCDSTDPQVLDNTTVLPRYATGAGVQVMAVSVAPTTGGGQFSFSYYNQDGVLRTSPTQICTTASAGIASIGTAQPAVATPQGPFLTLLGGDTGVRSIVDVTFSIPNGGLFALVLVYPLTTLTVLEVGTPSEKSWPQYSWMFPKIEDGAYLGLIMNCSATVAAGQLMGYATFVWK
jgi:hypothetical protein